MKRHKQSTLIRWATEGRIESASDIAVGRIIEIRYAASGKCAWVQVEAG